MPNNENINNLNSNLNLNADQNIQENQPAQTAAKNWAEIAARAESKEDTTAIDGSGMADFLTAGLPKDLLEHPSYIQNMEALTKIEQERDTYKQKALLVAADLDNARRRFERDLANAHKYAIDKFVLELLPVVDSLERGLEVKNGMIGGDEWLQKMHSGMELTLDILLKALEKYGVHQLNPVGEIFNPTFHEAMAVQNDPSVPENTVLRVVQKGYVLKERVVRPAMVLVAKGG